MTVDTIVRLRLPTGHASARRWMSKMRSECLHVWESCFLDGERNCVVLPSAEGLPIMWACSYSTVSVDVEFMQLHPSFKLIISLRALQLWSHTALLAAWTSLPIPLGACHGGCLPAEILAHYPVLCSLGFFQDDAPRIHCCGRASCLCMISAHFPVSHGERSMSSLI